MSRALLTGRFASSHATSAEAAIVGRRCSVFQGCSCFFMDAVAVHFKRRHRKAIGCFKADRQSLAALAGWARSSTLERRNGAPRRSESRKSLTRVDFILPRASRPRRFAFWRGRCAVCQVRKRVWRWKRSPVRGRLRERASKAFHTPASLRDHRRVFA